MWRPGAGQSDAHSPLGLPARSTATRSGYVPLHPRASSSAPVASSSDDEDGESLSGSSNCSSPRFFPSEEASVALAHQAVSVGEPSSSEALSGKTGEGGLRCVDGSAVGGLSSATAQREAERAAARQSKRVTKLYLRTIRVLAKMSLLLEDDRVIEHKREAPQSRKLGKLMLRYDRLLERLEASLQSRAPLPRGLSLENSGVPVGFLQALDDYADPREWIDLAVVKPHRRENAASRGLLYSIGSYQASILEVLKWGRIQSPLPPLHKLRPLSSSPPNATPPQSQPSASLDEAAK